VILTKAGISTVPNSVITGDIAVWDLQPTAIKSTAITGFSLSYDTANVSSTSTQVTGEVFATDYDPTNDIDELLTAAVGNMETAYNTAAGFDTTTGMLNLGAGILGVGGQNGGANAKLAPGVYTFGSGVSIQGDIFFDGGAADHFVMQISGDLQVTGSVIMSNGALAKNVIWQVSGAVNVAAQKHMEGIILGKTAVTFETGSSLTGRIFAQTHCALQKATITQPE
jgi:hypothetical protein